jgi:hypothetical protein
VSEEDSACLIMGRGPQPAAVDDAADLRSTAEGAIIFAVLAIWLGAHAEDNERQHRLCPQFSRTQCGPRAALAVLKPARRGEIGLLQGNHAHHGDERGLLSSRAQALGDAEAPWRIARSSGDAEAKRCL